MKRAFIFIGLIVTSLSYGQNNTQGMLNSYYEIGKSLAEDNSKGAAEKAAELYRIISTEGMEMKSVLKYVDQIKTASVIEQQRSAFSKLSDEMWQIVVKQPNIKQTVYRMYCPMKDAYWLSNTPTVENPYYGKSMLSCGKITGKH